MSSLGLPARIRPSFNSAPPTVPGKLSHDKSPSPPSQSSAEILLLGRQIFAMPCSVACFLPGVHAKPPALKFRRLPFQGIRLACGQRFAVVGRARIPDGLAGISAVGVQAEPGVAHGGHVRLPRIVVVLAGTLGTIDFFGQIVRSDAVQDIDTTGRGILPFVNQNRAAGPGQGHLQFYIESHLRIPGRRAGKPRSTRTVCTKISERL